MTYESELHTQGQLRVIAAYYKTGSYKDAAELLGLSPQTLKNHLNTARRLARVSTTEELFQMYWKALSEDEELRSTVGLNPRQIRYKYDEEYREKVKRTARVAMRKMRDRKAEGVRAHYDRLLATQGNVCAICGEAEGVRRSRAGSFVRLSVDHDHATGQIRELLCSTCNLMLGCAKDSVERLESGARYLRKHAQVTLHNNEEAAA
jgi:DNA-binding CsgD family transcriptional regulator/ribosomal protein L34E